MISGDSSFFIAQYDKKDKWHPDASRVARNLKERLLISDLVIAESFTEVGFRAGGKAGIRALHYFLDSCDMEFVDKDLFMKEMRLWLNYNAKLSVADAITVEINTQAILASDYIL